MRITTLSITTFLLVGATAASAPAQSLLLKGSDTLEKVTTQILANPACGGGSTGISYIGTGSSTGEAAMAGATQAVAPMSRFLKGGAAANGSTPTGTCTARPPGSTGPDATKAEGLVFALDGLAVVAAGNMGGLAACNGVDDPTCTQDNAHGLAQDTTVAGYTFGDVPVLNGAAGTTKWADVLRIVYAGMNASAGNTLANRDCNSAVRQALASDWHTLFENISDPPAATPNCNTATTGNCPGPVGAETQLRHAFRRNDESGTTDVFLSLLGLPSANLSGGVTGAAVSGNPPPGATGVSVFCNSVQAPDNLGPGNCAREATGVCSEPGSANAGPKYGESCTVGAATGTCARAGLTCYCQKALPTAGAFAGVAPPSTEIGALSGANPLSQSFLGPNFVDAQDFDPIRRTCAGLGLAEGSEDVCSARGDLGLVLPIWDPPQTATPYPATNCQNGKFIDMPWIRYRANGVNAFAHCPDGSPTASGTCPVPATSTGDPRCWSARRNGSSGGTLLPFYPNTFDGRVFNLYTFEDDGTGAFRIARTSRLTNQPQPNNGNVPPVITTTPLVGGFHRLHSVHGLQSGVHCTATSATDAIGCLVQASPCSIGYAGKEATGIVVAGGAGAAAMKLRGVDPDTQCVRNLIANATFPAVGSTYPISRRLYFNTMIGFDNVAASTPDGAHQAQLAACFANRATTDSIVSALHFTTLSDTAASRPTYCQDFDEFANCHPATETMNTDQCHARIANGDALPTCEENEAASTCTN